MSLIKLLRTRVNHHNYLMRDYKMVVTYLAMASLAAVSMATQFNLIQILFAILAVNGVLLTITHIDLCFERQSKSLTKEVMNHVSDLLIDDLDEIEETWKSLMVMLKNIKMAHHCSNDDLPKKKNSQPRTAWELCEEAINTAGNHVRFVTLPQGMCDEISGQPLEGKRVYILDSGMGFVNEETLRQVFGPGENQTNDNPLTGKPLVSVVTCNLTLDPNFATNSDEANVYSELIRYFHLNKKTQPPENTEASSPTTEWGDAFVKEILNQEKLNYEELSNSLSECCKNEFDKEKWNSIFTKAFDSVLPKERIEKILENLSNPETRKEKVSKVLNILKTNCDVDIVALFKELGSSDAHYHRDD